MVYTWCFGGWMNMTGLLIDMDFHHGKSTIIMIIHTQHMANHRFLWILHGLFIDSIDSMSFKHISWTLNGKSMGMEKATRLIHEEYRGRIIG